MDPELSPRQNIFFDGGEQNLLIVPCVGRIEERSCYQIFVVPVTQLGSSGSGSGCPELRPKFLVDCSEFGWELCVVGDRIYMFDSDCKPDSAVGAFDLSKHLLLNSDVLIKFKKETMCDMAPMRHQKRKVKTVTTPGGKILAFSTKIERRPPNFFFWGSNSKSNSRVVDFELYDPKTDCWEELPPIFEDVAPYHSFEISRYNFVDDMTFVIQTDEGGQFCLSLGAHRCGFWEGHFCSAPPLPLCGYTRAIGRGGDQLWLTPSTVCDIKEYDVERVCHFPISAFLSDPADPAFDFSPRSQTIVFFEEDKCFLLETGQHGLSGDHFLNIDIYKLDLLKYFKEKAGKSCAPQLECSLSSSTMFSLPAGSSLPLLAKTPIFIQPPAHGLA